MASYPASDIRRDAMPYGTDTVGSSAVSWAAIIAGAAGAAALGLILLILGTGLGLSAVSPWASESASAKSLGVGTAAWVTLTHLATAALSGYLAGRLRTKWSDVPYDEIAFRDTAHGFLAWAVGTLATAAFLSSAVTSLVSGGLHAGASVAGGAASSASAAAAGRASSEASDGDGGPSAYLIDSLFRSPKARAASGSPEASNAEITRIYGNAVAAGKMPEEDARYVGQVVAQRTGVSQQEGEKRAKETFNQLQTKKQQAQEAADQARKAAALASFWLFISLLLGAFVSSLCAVLGGRLRDTLH